MYEINVSKNRHHYFATHERSITTSQQAVELVKDFIKRFPKEEGFELSVSYNPQRGKTTYGKSLHVLTDEELVKTIDKLYF